MTAERTKILILGGYGTFGGRLVRLLADKGRLTLVIAGRSKRRAEDFFAGIASKAALLALEFDRDGDVEAQIKKIEPDIVVDASGPFQFYGSEPYRVVRAALALKIHYLDLADGSDFVTGIAQFDGEARARGVFILSGVSSFPVLTAAVVRQLARGFTQINAISGGIAPSPYAGVGLNVIRAIASYAGKPVMLIRDDKSANGYALTDTRRHTIAPPGRLPLRSTLFSLVDVPDLQVLPKLWPNLRSIWMGAGPAPEILHRALNAFAWLVRFKVLPSLSLLAPLMHRVTNIVRWGEHRGGMYVSVEGVRGDGSKVERSWHLLAEGDDGPFIPSMAAEAIIRHCLDGRPPQSGARPATNELEVQDYEALFARRNIFTGCRDSSPETSALPLYRRLLADAYVSLPQPLQQMHDLYDRFSAKGRATGRATVERGRGMLARLIAAMVGFPPAGHDVPVEVSFRAREGREYWQRTFAEHSFSSTQEAGSGRFAYLLCERFGPFTFGLALLIDGGRLRLLVRRWSVLGLPLPVTWAPFGDCYEHAENGRFCFHVEIGHPLTGPIVSYRGWLVPETLASDSARQTPSNPALVGLGVEI
jgi:NAD(P)-dependent dehydrogenase (short-subunit alcohol dehydrogenase family)